MRRRRIVRKTRDGTLSDFVAAGRDGLRSALGMRVDPKRRALWVASQAIPSMDGYEKDQPKIDDNGRTLSRKILRWNGATYK